jgi:hypothetical protein
MINKGFTIGCLLAASVLPTLVFGNVAVNEAGKKNTQGKNAPKGSYKVEAADCATPSAAYDLDINNVRARLFNGGDMWWDLVGAARYEVPKVEPAGSATPLTALFAGALWISGVDPGGNLKVAAQRFRARGSDFWPGPVKNDGTVDNATCTKFDRHFNVYGAEIEAAQLAFLANNKDPLSPSQIAINVLKWPGRGNPYLEADGFDLSNNNLAPFKDYDGDGIYNATKGDYPIIGLNNGLCDTTSGAFADQMIYWIMNDVGNIHSESNGEAIGLQINALAFAFKTSDEFNNMTFYRYNLINKSATPLLQTYIAQFADPDLGGAIDDRIGVDLTVVGGKPRNMAFVYNGDLNDEGSNGSGAYGTELPMLGIDFFEGPKDTSGVELGLSSFVYFTNTGSGPQKDPESAIQYRNYMTGLWLDGTPFTFGNTGYGGTVPTKFCFPGDPSDATQWSECSAGLPANDRRTVQVSGPFTMLANKEQNVTVGVVFVRPQGGVGLCPPFTTLGTADDKAQALFDNCFQLAKGPDAPTLDIRELDKKIIINLRNLEGSNNYGETYSAYSTKAKSILPNDTTDRVKYLFEGYKIYQLKDNLSSLDDATKAVLIAQVDIKNGIGRIINFVEDKSLGLYIPVEKVKPGSSTDKGIENSFVITTDVFSTTADQALVNHRKYYFTAVAYAYNNFIPYSSSAPDPENQQTEPYKQSDRNIITYSAIPHIPDPRNGGTTLKSEYGEGVEVTRIEGRGNGGNELELTQATIDKILISPEHYVDEVVYQKGKDPIGFKVVDPMIVKEADWELSFIDPDSVTGGPISDRVYWILVNLTTNDTIRSDRSLDRPAEQYITGRSRATGKMVDYGFSLHLGKPEPVYENKSNNSEVYPYISSEIIYSDPTSKWLSFLKDEGISTVTNWIRAGKGIVDISGAWDPNQYPVNNNTSINNIDPDFQFSNIADGTWAPYALSSNFGTKNPVKIIDKNGNSTSSAPYAYGPGLKWKNWADGVSSPDPQNNLELLNSVDIVFTSDTTKWTKCVVFETGEDELENKGAEISPNGKTSRKGQIRMAFSRHANGTIAYQEGVFDDLGNPAPDTGRSYFPGYAINLETGERLNISFGENSSLGVENGRDMIWNPTANLYSPVEFPSNPIPKFPYFGGGHFLYVQNTRYDKGEGAQQTLLQYFKTVPVVASGILPLPVRELHRTIIYTTIPYVTPSYSLKPLNEGTIPNEVKVKIRVEKPFGRFATYASLSNLDDVDSLPRYRFSTKGLSVAENQNDVAKSALDLIRVVPNPYYGYSGYETGTNNNVVKITNLPNKCTVTIYSLDGVLIRKFTRSIDIDPATQDKVEISDGAGAGDNLDNSLNWDMRNNKGIVVGSGVYLIYVNAEGIGEKTIRWFGGVRPFDASNF